ncbi:MAG TPA: hypothetical protein DDW36_04420 [Candidatus Magasanikbacteria bacterium]|nr:hypothetical protein [Candidatus Magasanikbacteria bacterium]
MLGEIQKIKPLIIFGAGASHCLFEDRYFESNKLRPPLNKDLFDTTNTTVKSILGQYPTKPKNASINTMGIKQPFFLLTLKPKNHILYALLYGS